MRQQGMLIVACVLLGCGPSVGNAEPELEEVCGSRGPVQLLDVEVPRGAIWGSTVVGDHRVAAWYLDRAAERAFEAYVLDACGGNETRLSARQFPLVVDGSAYVCDPMTGEVRQLDLASARAGEVLGAGYDCTPALRSSEALFLRNLDTKQWGTLTAAGLTALPVPTDPRDAEHYEVSSDGSIGPYLGRWAHVGTSPERVSQRVFAEALEDRMVLYDLDTGASSEVRGQFDALLIGEDGRDILLVGPPDGTGPPSTLSLAHIGADPAPGPPIAPVVGHIYGVGRWGGLLTVDRLLLAGGEGERPRPNFVQDQPAVMRIGTDRFLQSDENGIRVWDGSTQALLLDAPCPGETCSLPRYHADTETVLTSVRFDATTEEPAVWSFPLNGSAPAELLRTDQSWTVLPGDPLRIVRVPSGVIPGDLDVVDAESGAIETLAPRVDGLAIAPHLALPRPPEGTAPFLDYYMRQGDNAGLWLVGLPR